MSVEKFREDHFFLSNMYGLNNWIETEHGISVPTSEHAYQADRFVDEVDHVAVATVERGVEAKSLAHELLEQGRPQKEDWDFIKPTVMYGIVTQKFVRNSDIAAKLLATADEELVEGNTWGDRYWGVCPVGSRDGQNHLGKILMRVRFDLRNLELSPVPNLAEYRLRRDTSRVKPLDLDSAQAEDANQKRIPR